MKFKMPLEKQMTSVEIPAAIDQSQEDEASRQENVEGSIKGQTNLRKVSSKCLLSRQDVFEIAPEENSNSTTLPAQARLS